MQLNAGAKIAGEWSRFDLITKNAEYSRGAITNLQASLPAAAHAIYFKDAIGNISSSREPPPAAPCSAGR